MIGSQYLYVRAELALATDLDGTDVQKHAAVIEKAASADPDVVAIVTIKGRAEFAVLPEPAEQVSQDPAGCRVAGPRLIVVVHKKRRSLAIRSQLRIARIVEVPGEHPGLLGAGYFGHERVPPPSGIPWNSRS